MTTHGADHASGRFERKLEEVGTGMALLARRPWVDDASEDFIERLAGWTANQDVATIADQIERLIVENGRIHEEECINLNPASNIMNPKAEAALARGLGTRASLGYPSDKY